jgi:hypothetical protein
VIAIRREGDRGNGTRLLGARPFEIRALLIPEMDTLKTLEILEPVGWIGGNRIKSRA